MPAQNNIEIDASPLPHPTPYDTALSFMPVLLFIGAVIAIVKGWAWFTDRTQRGARTNAVIETRLDDLEKVSKDVQSHTGRLNNHEMRIAVVETTNAHINTTLGELKSDIKHLSENVMKAVSRREP